MIYIGNFVYLTNQEQEAEAERRHGEFSLMVQAEESQSAIDLFRTKIVETRNATEMLGGECRIFFIQLIEMDMLPENHPMIVNFKSIAGDPVMPFIRCTVPGENQQVCRIFDWKNNRPEIDGQDEQLFLEFES